MLAPDRSLALFKSLDNPRLVIFRQIEPGFMALPKNKLDAEPAPDFADAHIVVANLQEFFRLASCEFVFLTLTFDRAEKVLFPFSHVGNVREQSRGQSAKGSSIFPNAVDFLPRRHARLHRQ